MARITFQKRQKEMKRLEKRQEKAERRAQRKLAKLADPEAQNQDPHELQVEVAPTDSESQS